MEFPYEYGSDLHWLWGWGHRIELRLADTKRDLHEYDRLVFRPDTAARDAMTRFSVAYQYPIKAIDDCLTFVDQRFAEFLHDPANIGSFEMALLSLRERIAASVAVIAEAEAARKPTDGKRKAATSAKPGRPTPTADEIKEMQDIQRDWLAYTRFCRDKRIKLREGEAWQEWRTEYGKSDRMLSLEYVTKVRIRYKEWVRYPDNTKYKV